MTPQHFQLLNRHRAQREVEVGEPLRLGGRTSVPHYCGTKGRDLSCQISTHHKRGSVHFITPSSRLISALKVPNVRCPSVRLRRVTPCHPSTWTRASTGSQHWMGFCFFSIESIVSPRAGPHFVPSRECARAFTCLSYGVQWLLLAPIQVVLSGGECKILSWPQSIPASMAI